MCRCDGSQICFFFLFLFNMSGISKNVFLRIKDISGDVSAGSQVCCPLKVKEEHHHLQSANFQISTEVIGVIMVNSTDTVFFLLSCHCAGF